MSLKSEDSPNLSTRRSESMSRERSKSRDTFVKFPSWRRKSEPGVELSRFFAQEKIEKPQEPEIQIPQYNSKTIPKKIYKIKKARNKLKETTGATFYTDLSDSATCDEVLHISESCESLEKTDEVKEVEEVKAETVEDIVSQLLMQNREFQRILSKTKPVGIRNRMNKVSWKKCESSDSEGDYETLLNNAGNGKEVGSSKVKEVEKIDNLGGLKFNNELKEADYVMLSFKNEVKYDDLNKVWKDLNDKNWEDPTEVWLKQQGEHLATSPTQKSGSLPRSFEIMNDTSGLKYKLQNDRPVTIANDNDLDVEVNEFQLEPVVDNTLTDAEHIYEVPNHNSTTSINSLPGIHPEYKIYRPTINLSTIRSVLNKSNRKSIDSEDERLEKRPNQASTIVRNYSRSLIQRFKSILTEESLTETSPTSYKQGSKSLGARIALSDYANPTELFETYPEQTLINKQSIRPDSLLSFSSHFTSSSDSSSCNCVENCTCEKKQSFYEKQFEKIEDETLFRDSAVYSDHEEPKVEIEIIETKKPPPVPTKPERLLKPQESVVTIADRLQLLKKNSFTENEQKRSQFLVSESLVSSRAKFLQSTFEGSEDIKIRNFQCVEKHNLEEMIHPNSKGWVKHVVNKFQ